MSNEEGSRLSAAPPLRLTPCTDERLVPGQG